MQRCQALAVSDVRISAAIKQATGLLEVVLNSRGVQLRSAMAINTRHAHPCFQNPGSDPSTLSSSWCGSHAGYVRQPSSRSTSVLADWPVRLRRSLGLLMRSAMRLVLG